MSIGLYGTRISSENGAVSYLGARLNPLVSGVSSSGDPPVDFVTAGVRRFFPDVGNSVWFPTFRGRIFP